MTNINNTNILTEEQTTVTTEATGVEKSDRKFAGITKSTKIDDTKEWKDSLKVAQLALNKYTYYLNESALLGDEESAKKAQEAGKRLDEAVETHNALVLDFHIAKCILENVHHESSYFFKKWGLEGTIQVKSTKNGLIIDHVKEENYVPRLQVLEDKYYELTKSHLFEWENVEEVISTMRFRAMYALMDDLKLELECKDDTKAQKKLERKIRAAGLGKEYDEWKNGGKNPFSFKTMKTNLGNIMKGLCSEESVKFLASDIYTVKTLVAKKAKEAKKVRFVDTKTFEGLIWALIHNRLTNENMSTNAK